MNEETVAYVAAEQQPPPVTRPNLKPSELRVLRLVKAGDPFRDKARGKAGKLARIRVLNLLAW